MSPESFPSIRILMNQAAPDGQEHDADVEPGVPVRDVVKVELNPFSQRGIAPPAVDLCPTGDAALDTVTSHVVRNRLGELLDEVRSFWTGTDEGHIAE